jgi:hypothetical protein
MSRMLPSRCWAICRPGRDPVEITSGESIHEKPLLEASLMRKPPTIGEFTLSFTLSPSSRRGVHAVTLGGAPTPYTIEKHALWCLFLDGQAMPVARAS